MRRWLVFGGSAAAAFVIAAVSTFPRDAQAFWRSASALYCTVNSRDMNWGSYSVANNSTSTTMYLSCGIPNDSNGLFHGDGGPNATTLTVNGDWNGNTSVLAYACYSNWATASGSCGASASASTNPYSISPQITGAGSWASAPDGATPYIIVALGARYNGTDNTLRGYYVSY
jgi:hypothetical protein